MEKLLKQDIVRYKNSAGGKMPFFQKALRKFQDSGNFLLRLFWRVIYKFSSKKNQIEISPFTKIGGGLYLGHPYSITINPRTTIGKNCNIHRGVLIGQENRGCRKGVPTVGDCVWIGINAAVVGSVNIGDDVLIAPNSYVNCDVPSHSVVFGNPCIIKRKDCATENYINNKYIERRF